MLELLKKTDHPAWRNVQISPTNIEAWEEEGDLADLLVRRETNVVYERDEHGVELSDDPSPPPGQNSLVDVLNDGGDTGPAELQNTEAEDTTYETVIHFGASTETSLADAHLAAAEVERVVSDIRDNAMPHDMEVDGQSDDAMEEDNAPLYIRGGNDDASPGDTDPSTGHPSIPPFRMNADNTVATVRQEDIVTTVGFVDMFQQEWAFAQAFPSLFIPRPVLEDGEVRWKIYHDFKGAEGQRSKDVDFNSWLELQIWRSDGAPAAHSTFGLIAINLKMKKALVQQGLYVLSTSGMDPNTMAKNIVDAEDGTPLQEQIKDLIKRLV